MPHPESRHGAHLQVFVVNNTAWIMRLQSKCSRGNESAWIVLEVIWFFRLGIVCHQFAIDFDPNSVAFHFDKVIEPLPILGGNFAVVFDRIKTACLAPVAMSVVDLSFISSIRPTFVLVFCMKINASMESHPIYFARSRIKRFSI